MSLNGTKRGRRGRYRRGFGRILGEERVSVPRLLNRCGVSGNSPPYAKTSRLRECWHVIVHYDQITRLKRSFSIILWMNIKAATPIRFFVMSRPQGKCDIGTKRTDKSAKRSKAAKDDFQGDQTAKARPGSPCAVTPLPKGTWPAFDSDEEAYSKLTYSTTGSNRV